MRVSFHFDNNDDQEKKALGILLFGAVVILGELILILGLVLGLLTAVDVL